MKRLLFIPPALVLSIALAQDSVPLDFAAWASDVGILAAVVMTIIGFVREKVWTGLDGIMVNIVAVILGGALGLGLWSVGHFEAWTGGLVHGLMAGAASFIGVDAVRQILGTRKASTDASGGTLPR